MNLDLFADKLPIPQVLKPRRKKQGVPYYIVRMQQFKHSFHSSMPQTTTWGFEGSYPGPVIEVRPNQKIKVKWVNHLPVKHLLPVDTTIHGAEPNVPRVRTVIHLHGAVVRPESDGYPDAWFTRGYRVVGPKFERKIYDYPNLQRPTTLWYHAHAIGITRLNVYAGLAGVYLIRDPLEYRLNLPRRAYDIVLFISDKSFNDDGSLYYPSQTDPPTPGVNPSIVSDFFGDTILVNGKVWPYLEVEPRKYRFRIINGSNSRFYNMKLSSGQPFYQIGSDGGLLEAPVVVNQLLLSPAERAEVVLDFCPYMGDQITLTNDAPASYPNGSPVDPNTTGQIMQFRVNQPLAGPDYSEIPARLSKIKPLRAAQANVNRNLTLDRQTDRFGRSFLLLNNTRWTDPISIKPRLWDTEVWTLINRTNATHPIHIHLVNFQILDRQPFDLDYFNKTNKIKATGLAIPPDPNERGWKDTVRANPGEITRIIMKFEPFSGLYPWHCHILEHEDHEMMLPFEIQPY